MAILLPVGYNTGSTISGTLQYGSLAIGQSLQDYGTEPTGVRFWSTPDLSLGYVIATPVPAGNQPNDLTIPCFVGFYGTSDGITPNKTESAFVALANGITNNSQNFTTGNQAKTWLEANGYWTSWITQSDDLNLFLDAGNLESYPSTGTIWYDISGYNNNGTLSGVTFSENDLGCFDFDGSLDFVQTPLVTTSTTNVSIEVWFNSDDVNQAGQMLVYNGSDNSANGFGIAVNNEGATSGNIFILYGGVAWYDTGVSLSSNVWYQSTMTISGNSLVVYLNGAQVYSATVATPNTPTSYTEIGRNDYPALRYFNGQISIVKIWNRVLNASEVQTEWNNYQSRYGYIPTPTPTITTTPTKTPTPTVTPTMTITPSITITPTITRTPTVTPTITPTSSTAVTFSQTFINGQAPGTTIENAWTTFRSQLTGSYTTFTFTSSLVGATSYTVTDAVKVQTLATNLKNGTATSQTIGANTWLVGCCACRQGGTDPNAVEFSNVASCSGSSTAALRPWINNLNWGGIGSTVGAATQTLTLTFY